MYSGLKDKVAIITGTNNPQGIGATTALAFAREGVRLALIYKKSRTNMMKAKLKLTDLTVISKPIAETWRRLRNNYAR